MGHAGVVLSLDQLPVQVGQRLSFIADQQGIDQIQDVLLLGPRQAQPLSEHKFDQFDRVCDNTS
jgi:hypothetical protein